MKNISLFLLLLIFLSSCSHLSLDFAKRKYRPGYYVNLSSTKKNLKIRQFESPDRYSSPVRSYTSDNHPDLIGTDINKNPTIPEGRRIPARMLSSVIHPQSFQSSTPIKNNLQNEAVYNRSENRVIEKDNVKEDKPEKGTGKYNVVAIVSFGFAVLAVILIMVAFSNYGVIFRLLFRLSLISFLVSIILGKISYDIFKEHPELKGRGFSLISLIVSYGTIALAVIGFAVLIILLSQLH